MLIHLFHLWLAECNLTTLYEMFHNASSANSKLPWHQITFQYMIQGKSKKVVIVGGGYIGMEVAAAAVAWNLDTTVSIPLDSKSLNCVADQVYFLVA